MILINKKISIVGGRPKRTRVKGGSTVAGEPLSASHNPFVIHSNGARECFCGCGKIFIPPELRDVYDGPAYRGRVVVVEDK